MGNMLKHINILLIPALLLASIVLVIPQLNNRELMLPTQSSKAFGLLWGMLGYLVVALFIAAIKRQMLTIRITAIDILLGAYSLLVAISYWQHPIDQIQMLTYGALVIFYLSVRVLNRGSIILLFIAVVISGTIQAVYGNLQLWGYLPSNHGIFKLTGSFFNPGPYSGYLAAIFPISLGFYLFNFAFSIPKQNTFFLKLVSYFIQAKSVFKRITSKYRFFYNNSRKESLTEEQENSSRHTSYITMKSFFLISIISMCLVLPASRSRAAWLAVLGSSGYLLSAKYQFLSQIMSTFNTRIKQYSLILSLIIVLIITSAGLYYFKQGSADGRVLIWKVSAGMIKDKPVWGHGTDKFAAEYMNYQAAYFKANPNALEAMQADDVTYAYNEILKIIVEKGLIGLLLALATIGCLLFGKTDPLKRNNSLFLLAARGSLLSILVFALFSYPSEILPIKMLFLLSAAVVTSYQNPIRLFHVPTNETALEPIQKAAFASSMVWYTALGTVLIGLYPAGKYLTQQYHAYKSWNDASDIYGVGNYPECLEDFVLAYPQLKTNGSFLIQYGKAFEMAGDYKSSIAILNEAKQYLNNTILYTCLGNNYKALGKNIQAEKAYLLAYNMTPIRFFPLYLLAKLYDETGQKAKAVLIAKKVMEKGIKIESTAIEEIKEEMRKIIEKNEVEILIERKVPTENSLGPIYKWPKEGVYRFQLLTDKFKLRKW